MKRFFFFVIFLLNLSFANAQYFGDVFREDADSLSGILFGNFPDEEKLIANQQLEMLTLAFLQSDSSLQFTYDSLLFASYVQSEDESFSLLTWVIPLADHHYMFSGFFQMISHKQIDTVYCLKPLDVEVENNLVYSMQKWPEAVYKQILPKGKKEKYYTLLGWVGKPEGLAGKRIETLTFDSLGQPVFGVPAFTMKDGSVQNRIDFEYTNEVPFHLSYELQRLPGEKRKTGWMIVFNQIGGNTPGMGRVFRGPVPSFEFFDAFVPINEKWVFFEDVHPRANTKDLSDEPPTEIGLPEIRKK